MSFVKSIPIIYQQSSKLQCIRSIATTPICFKRIKEIKVPEPGKGVNYRRRIIFPEKYTIEPLKVRKLGGRDPVTGRKVCEGIGGGWPQFFLWVDLFRKAPKEGPPLVERVLRIMKDPVHTADIALVGSGDHLRYVLATENMKVGNLIKTSAEIPRNAVRANEGDAHPLGALPIGTKVHCVEKKPGEGGYYSLTAGTFVTILRKVGDKIILQLPSKHEVCVSQECMACVGRLSNVEHNTIPIGSAVRARQLGNRPRSGLWHRKTGRNGRKIKRLPPIKDITIEEKRVVNDILSLTLPGEDRIKTLY